MSGAGKAVCYICGKDFMNQKYCNRHIKRIHNVHTIGEPAEPAEKVICVTCGKQYNQKSSLQRHNDVVHNVDSNKSLPKLKCDQCDYETFYKSNLQRHLMKKHQNENPNRQFKCSMCSSKFSHLKSLKYHEKTKHMLGTKKYTKRKCPLCEYISYENRRSVIYKHFETKHNIVMNWQTHTFNSQEDFKLWKRSVEQENAVYYMPKCKSEKDFYRFYICNRSGNYVSKGSNVRKTKSLGSCKINGFCPSAMLVNQESDSVVVKYLPVHVGHEKDPKYLRISLGGLGCGKKYKRAMRERREREKSKIKETHVEENAFIVAVIGDNDIISNEVVIEENEVVIEEGIVQEINGEADIDNVASEPHSYTEDHDTTLYLEKVKLVQEFREFEGFLQNNLTSIEQIEYVRREIVKIVTDIKVSNSAVNIK